MSTPPAPVPETAEGVSSNVLGGLAYITVIPAIIFLVMAPYNKDPFVRFHAWQSVILGVGTIVVNTVLFVIPILGWIISAFVMLGVLVFWLIAMFNAFQGKKWKIPFIGSYAEQMAAKGGI